MTTPFNPDVIVPGSGNTSNTKTLPNGSYDIYNVRDIYDGVIYLGQSQRTIVGGPEGQGRTNLPATPATTNPQQYIQQFAGMSVTDPQTYAALQAQMYSAGFYGTSKPRFGIYTPKDAAAMKDAVTGYLGVVNTNTPNPLTITDYLDHAAQQGDANGDNLGTAPAPPPPVQYTDPKALKATLQSAAENALHRQLDDAELNHFVAAFHGQEKSAHDAYYAGKPSNNPDATAQAQSVVQEDHKDEAGQALQAGYADVMNQMLGVNSGG